MKNSPVIKLDGLTQRQVVIADLIWNSDDPYAIINKLPTKKDQCDAYTIMDLIIHECIEEEVGLHPAEQIVNDLLKRVMEK